MVERLIVDEMKFDKVDLLFNLTQLQTRKIHELLSYFRNTPSDLSPSIIVWLECSDVYYRMLACYALFLKNGYMFDRLIEKTKESEQIYFEKNLLANAILDTKDHFANMAERCKSNPSLVEFARHGLGFLNEKIERELKKAISTFESIKGDLNLKKFTGLTIEGILTQSFITTGEDKIEAALMNEAGIAGKNK